MHAIYSYGWVLYAYLEKFIQILMPIESTNLTGMSSKDWVFPYL